MLEIFGVFDPLVVIERDRAFGDIEGEFAIGAFVVLPATMGLLEKVVSETLDRVPNGESCAFDVGLAPTNLRDHDVTVGNLRRLVAGCRVNVLDLATVAGAIEVDEDAGDAGSGERVKQSRLVGRTDGIRESAECAILLDKVAGIEARSE